jgi:diguanylate cyclase (GGDEF)-like protein
MRGDSLQSSAISRRARPQAQECGRDEIPTLTEELGGGGASAQVRDRASLTVMSGDDTGKLIRLGDGELVVGRGADADVRLSDASVSLRHAKLFRVEDHVYLQDLQSRHGTWVGGKKIDSPVRLRDGDQVQVGLSRVFRFNLNSPAEEEAAEQLYESAVRDPTSGAYNRRHFERKLEAERAFAAQRGLSLVLLLLDIDEFKALNDTHGHVLGDAVLQVVAASVQRLLRPEDTLVRFGGDEFVVLCRDMTLRNGLILAERIRANVERLPFSVHGNDLHVTVSVGVAEAQSHDSACGRLVESADQALYRAKHHGRNSVASAG